VRWVSGGPFLSKLRPAQSTWIIRLELGPCPALYLLHALYNGTGGQPHERHMVVALDGMTAEAIVFAIAQGWVIVEAGQAICLTDAGPGLVEAG
jgi:hypothetical protein